MAEFFHLNSQDIENPANAEDKVISREQRIFADNVIFAHGDIYKVKTTSTAYRQKLKFFVDVVEYTDPDTQKTFKYRCGYYYECEHYESVRLFTSLGFMSFYFVVDRIVDGEFTFAFYISNENVKLYVSSVVFEDSFYNPEKGWLNPNNPDNIIDALEDDDDPNIPTIPGYVGGGYLMPYIIIDTPLQNVGDYIAYEDDFCRISYTVRQSTTSWADASINDFFVFLKGDYKPAGVNQTNSANISTMRFKNGSGTAGGLWSAANGTITNDGFYLPWRNGTSSDTAFESIMDWKALDGYTYSMRGWCYPANNLNSTNTTIRATFWYMGRSKTDAPPV